MFKSFLNTILGVFVWIIAFSIIITILPSVIMLSILGIPAHIFCLIILTIFGGHHE